MNRSLAEFAGDESDQMPVVFEVELNRRDFLHTLGAGLLIVVSAAPAMAQSRRGGGGGRSSGPVAARVHLGEDGSITVLTGKIEMGQGARAELTQAAAEELRLPPTRLRLVMGETARVPDDGGTSGSRTTPSTVPAVRQGCAAARELLLGLAAQKWNVEKQTLAVRDGVITHAASQRTLTYADLAKNGEAARALAQSIPPGITLTPTKDWQVMGRSFPRPNAPDLVTGAHRFPSDYTRPNMLYGKILRPPSYGAKLLEVDLAPARAWPDVKVVREGSFVGVAAPTTFQARLALEAVARTAKWEKAAHPSSKELFTHLRKNAPRSERGNLAAEFDQAKKVLQQTFEVAYVQHAPMETRTALAEWNNGKLTVWTATQNPFGYHGDLAREFNLPREKVEVIVPDFGCGFGGKHTAECAIEAARLAKGVERPVLVRWTRQEEFTWAYFRPAALIDAEAGLDDTGKINVWHFININSGGSAVDTPYRIPHARSRFVPSNAPLRQGSYRTLAATANNFAREVFMDELAEAAGADPLEFRLAHLENTRIRAVLEAAAQRFNWSARRREKKPGLGVGLACGTEKNSVVATCAEVTVDSATGQIVVRHVCEVFECGAIINPDNLLSQVQGCIIMGLGAALREEMRFEEGKMLTTSFSDYRVPRFKDVPTLDIHLLDRPDAASVGGGETPIIGIAPAVANAVWHATGQRIRRMPIKLPAARA